jgi:hypothetical protein
MNLPLPSIVPVLIAGFVLALPAQAAIIETGNLLRADTGVSAPSEIAEVTAGAVPFDRATQSQGLGAQGQVSATRAAQQIGFEGDTGISGSSTLEIALSAGVSGEARAVHEALFEVGGRSAFTLSALFESLGNGGSDSFIQIDQAVSGLSLFNELLRFDLDASPTLDFSGFLDAGFYRLTVFDTLASADPGEGGSNRLTFAFDLGEAGVGNAVPEPSSLALVLGGLWAARALRRGAARG